MAPFAKNEINSCIGGIESYTCILSHVIFVHCTQKMAIEAINGHLERRDMQVK